MVDCAKKCISELEEKLESLDEWVDDLLKLQNKKDQMIESLQQELLVKSMLEPKVM